MRVCCHGNETRAPIANPPNTAQLEGTPYHSSKLHPGPCSRVVWQCGEGHTDTDTHTAVASIHFASATTNAKCNVISQLSVAAVQCIAGSLNAQAK